MYESLAGFTIRRRWWIVAVTVVLLLAGGLFGVAGVERLAGGGLTDPSSESTKATEVLTDKFNGGSANLVILVSAEKPDTQDAIFRDRVGKIVDELETTRGVSDVQSYLTPGHDALIDESKSRTLITAHVAGEENEALKKVAAIKDSVQHVESEPRVVVTGALALQLALEESVTSDLSKSESIAIPILLIALVIVFGAVVAAALPLMMGLAAILSTLGVLGILTLATDVSMFALNLTTALGLGLAIDYALLIVSRFRLELDDCHDVDSAIIRTVASAGRTVVWSAATVAVSLSALLIFPQFFLRSFGYAGVAIVVTSAVIAVVLLPALLAILGRRVNKGRVPWSRRQTSDVENGIWYRRAIRVMQRPVIVAVPIVLVLLALGVPFLSVQFGLFDNRVLAEGNVTREASEEITRSFDSNYGESVFVALPDTGKTGSNEIDEYAAELSELPNVDRVESSAGLYVEGALVMGPTAALQNRFRSGSAEYLIVVSTVPGQSIDGEKLVVDVRETTSPSLAQVAGVGAELVDAKKSIGDHVPWAILIVVIATSILLLLTFRSIFLPIKALILNGMSLSAVYGLMVVIFQDGALSSILGFTPTGMLNLSMPILMFCIAFGLSMDYEVFLVTRIQEEKLAHGVSDEIAVATGLQRTGGIITAAASLMTIVFVSFATSGVMVIKLFGLGVAVAVLTDAVVIRPFLVPAFMKLAGRANWWLPVWLDRILPRIGEPSGEVSASSAKACGVRPEDGRPGVIR